MSLPITVRKTIDEPPTRPLTPLEKAEAEIVVLRARVKELETLLAEAEESKRGVLGILHGGNAGHGTKIVEKKHGLPSDLEVAQAEVEMLWAELLNAQYEALRRVERVGAKLGKHTKSVKKNVQSA